MTTIHTRMAIVAVCGVIAGASLVTVLRAQSSSAPAYLVANIEQVTDAATMAKYRAQAGKTEAAFGGKAIARGDPQALDSSPLPKGNIVIIAFPSMKALKDWWSSPAYTAVRPLREKSSVSRVYAVEGVAAP